MGTTQGFMPGSIDSPNVCCHVPHKVTKSHQLGFSSQGYLHAEYNAMTLNRYKVRSETPLPTGNVTIEVEVKFDSRQRRSGGAITFRVHGEQVGQGRFEDSVPVIFTASETFDVGMDLGSPVSLDYRARAPFKFNGQIEKINIKYV